MGKVNNSLKHTLFEMKAKTSISISTKIPNNIVSDIDGYQFQQEPWMCWITCIKNILITMKKHHPSCLSPTIRNLNRSVGAKNGIIPNFETVVYLINDKILNNVAFKLVEKSNSNLKEFKNIVDSKETSPVIFSVNPSEYFKIMTRKYKYNEIGYDIEGSQGIDESDHALISFKINEDVIFFDPYTPFFNLPGTNTPLKAIFKLPTTILDKLWNEAIISSRWIMWLEKKKPHQQRLKITQKY